MRTVADLKRKLTVGTTLTLKACYFYHRFLGIPRKINAVNTVGFQVGGSFMDWPKAKELTWHSPNEFRIDLGSNYYTYTIE